MYYKHDTTVENFDSKTETTIQIELIVLIVE